MAAARERIDRMSLRDFYRYLEDCRSELAACYKDVEEVQFEFNDIFKRELAAWQELVAYLFPRVATQRAELPEALAALIDDAEKEERARICDEIAGLTQKIEGLQGRSDELLRRGQEATESLKRTNPKLNQREEALAARMAALQTEYAEAFERLEPLGSPLDRLAHWGERRKLKKEQERIKREQALTLDELRQVRQEWATKLQELSNVQAELREQWQAVSVELAQAQARRDHLQANLEPLALQAALQRVFQELDQPPEAPGELGQKLAELVQRNRTRRMYEHGLTAVAETIGLTKGVGEGLTRFQKSVGTVLEEQQRYSLKEVQVELPRRVIAMNEIWSQLRAKVQDEKRMGRNPTEFGGIVKGYIAEHLTDARIQALFEEMGAALNKATKAWA